MSKNPQMDRLVGPILEWAKKNQQLALDEQLAKSNTKGVSNFLIKTSANYQQALARIEAENKFEVPLNFTGKEYVSMLISIDAEIEHGLMLQYLFAAYTIGGSQVPEKYRERVQSWQNIILGIAKEEMGHFISVQNVLKVMGAPLNFGRESYPWDTPFYPFPFTLEKLTLKSLAKYVYAEAPSVWLNDENDELVKEIKTLVKSEVEDPHTVGALFKVILALIKDPEVVPDEVFQSSTYPYQAKADEWQRGYAGEKELTEEEKEEAYKKEKEEEERTKKVKTESEKIARRRPDVLVVPLASRDDAVGALEEIAEQGEGEGEVDLESVMKDTDSHFYRFLTVYKDIKAVLAETGGTWEFSRNVGTNPYVKQETKEEKAARKKEEEAARKKEEEEIVLPNLDLDIVPLIQEETRIMNKEACLWANLFNLRYRMLLNFLNHSFLLDEGLNKSGAKAPRGLIINSTFGEMYNLRSIAMVLVRTPANIVDNGVLAGPPFTLPYTLDLPFGEHNRWRLHQDLIKASYKTIEALYNIKGQSNRHYLDTLSDLDASLLKDIQGLTSYKA